MDNLNGKWTVLVVDDDLDNLSVAVQVLEFHGCKCYEAADGIEGLEILENVTPTFILLDLSMPRMDGWTMLARIRAKPHLKDVPVIAVTAHAMTGDRERVLKAGFDAYIAKPFRLDTFMEEIQGIVNKLTVK